ncbi:hypothetical protein C1H46_026782 [Malus baccata]|uniref:Uncharacterized protein n=1 Tax=Malus baccata TaxID=106549 RepID=A0A540LMF4_MALBA|nr:hypothetical protein C1H46_026782 [Malus baccata]
MHVATGNYENLIVAGITDPTKVGFFIKYFMNRMFRRSNRWDRLKKVKITGVGYWGGWWGYGEWAPVGFDLTEATVRWNRGDGD